MENNQKKSLNKSGNDNSWAVINPHIRFSNRPVR